MSGNEKAGATSHEQIPESNPASGATSHEQIPESNPASGAASLQQPSQSNPGSEVLHEHGPESIPARRPFQVLNKPTGSMCNLNCSYCFYLGKSSLYPDETSFRMNADVQEALIRQYLQSQPPNTEEVNVAWQGGEPTLMGLDFFRRSIELTRKYAPSGMKVQHSIQTNGTLLDEDWGRFLKEHRFLVGISIDGPEEIHNRNRPDKGGVGSFGKVMRGLEILKKYGVEFNTLTVVNALNGDLGADLYDFLKAIGSRYFQFIPIVEHVGAGLTNVGPGGFQAKALSIPLLEGIAVSDRSVGPEQWGRFLNAQFDRWIELNDVGRIFIQHFDMMVGLALGLPSTLCVHAETCGWTGALEHNGDLFFCDHFVEPAYRLGNITQESLGQMISSEKQREWGRAKRNKLPRQCLECNFLKLCWGACPKDRVALSKDGEEGLNYLCKGYYAFYEHSIETFERMAGCLKLGHPARDHRKLETLQGAATARERAATMARAKGNAPPVNKAVPTPKRNDPCYCGSGLKFKRCCGKS